LLGFIIDFLLTHWFLTDSQSLEYGSVSEAERLARIILRRGVFGGKGGGQKKVDDYSA